MTLYQSSISVMTLYEGDIIVPVISLTISLLLSVVTLYPTKECFILGRKGDRIYHQLRKSGSSLDWDRAVFTMDEVGFK